MYRYKLMIKQFFCWHEYKPSETRGWYGEPKPGATCLKCKKVSK